MVKPTRVTNSIRITPEGSRLTQAELAARVGVCLFFTSPRPRD